VKKRDQERRQHSVRSLSRRLIIKFDVEQAKHGASGHNDSVELQHSPKHLWRQVRPSFGILLLYSHLRSVQRARRAAVSTGKVRVSTQEMGADQLNGFGARLAMYITSSEIVRKKGVTIELTIEHQRCSEGWAESKKKGAPGLAKDTVSWQNGVPAVARQMRLVDSRKHFVGMS